MKQSIKKFTAIFILQMFLSVNTVCAQIESSTPAVSYLSPALNISVENFDQSFRSYFSEQSAILNQPDTIQVRIKFTNDLYVLPFKSLFPQIIQYQLFQGIKQNLLKQVGAREIVDIQVEYVSNDSVYALFKQQGEKNLNSLIGNQQLKEQLLPIKQTRDREWIALEGYNPPSKKRAHPDTIEKYKRKWLLESISGVTGYSKKELKEKPTGALWIIYFQYKLVHEFGRKLIQDVKAGRAAEFKVNIRLKDQREIEAYIAISGDKYNVAINQTKGIVTAVKIPHALLKTVGSLSFEQRIDEINDESFRQQMHILQSQTTDLTKVLAALDSLNRIKDIDLADWQKGVSAEAQEKLKQDLNKINFWLGQTPEFVNNRQQEKYQAHLLLEQIIKKQGKLDYQNYPAIIANIKSAIACLDRRVIFLFSGIHNRNILLFDYANNTQDYYFYTQALKNELAIAQAAIKIDVLSISLDTLNSLKSLITLNSVFSTKLAKDSAVVEAIKLVQNNLKKADNAKLVQQAIVLVNQVETDKTQTIALVVKQLQSVEKWLKNKKLTDYAGEVSLIIKGLSPVADPGISFYQIVNNSLSQIDQLTKNIDGSTGGKMNPGFKKIIINKFSSSRSMLLDMKLKVSRRNQIIKKVFPVQEITSLKQARELLDIHFKQKSGYDSYAQMQADLIEQMQYAVKSLSESQSGFYRSSETIRLGDIIPGIIQCLSQPLYNGQLLGQAI